MGRSTLTGRRLQDGDAAGPAGSRNLERVDAATDGAPAVDNREDRLFRSVDDDNDDAVSLRDFERVLAEAGLHRSDRRLADSIRALKRYTQLQRRTQELEANALVPREGFCQAIRHNIVLIERALQGRMVVPDFRSFGKEIEHIYRQVRENRDGATADYIPQLAVSGEEADRFAVAVCTVDGQRLAIGDYAHFFTLQSTTKPISYCLALEEHGPDFVHSYIGHEPSGASFNELTLNKHGRPHNPMINAGAIMSSALIGLREKRRLPASGSAQALDTRGWSGRRFEHVVERWRALCGGETPRFSTSVFLSERETADRNYALAYFMREKGAFPDGVDLHDALEFYLQCCSIEVNAEMMSVVAATLANGGICPVTGERVFSTATVRSCLSLMSSCGMYDFSGQFSFAIGLPAKSGVSGAIMVVVPNVMGFCTWSPRLDELGNSVRGVAFCRRLVETFNFHNFDDLSGSSGKRDPRLDPIQLKSRQVNGMIWAASKGDVGAIHEQMRRDGDLTCRDYDLRTPLHLAAAENQPQVVQFYIDQARALDGAIDLSPRDRWGGTPLDDAHWHGNDEIVSMLQAAGARRGRKQPPGHGGKAARCRSSLVDSPAAGELIWAASLGELAAVRRLVAQGVPLDSADYDSRTALHLAAAEGHQEVVRYFLAHGVGVNPLDRWGHTPLDDAERHGHGPVAALLREHGASGWCDAGDKTRAARRKAAA